MIHSPYSYSRISTYKQCPRKFKYHYIDKIKTEEVEHLALSRGGYLHDLIEHYGGSVSPTITEIFTIEKVQECDLIIDKFLSSNLGKEFVFGSGGIVEIGKETEIGLRITKDGVFPCSYHDDKVLVRGAIDKLGIMGNVLLIFDWKSGRMKDPKYFDELQTQIYAIWGFLTFPLIDEIHSHYVYIEHNTSNKYIYKRKYLNNYINNLKSPIKLAESDKTFNKQESKLCDYCEYQTICEKDNL